MKAAGLDFFCGIMEGWKRLDSRGLIVGAEAARAEVDALHFTVYHNPGRVDVGRPAAVGMTLGVADVMPEHRGLPAKIALHYRSPWVPGGNIAKTCYFIVPYDINNDKMSILDGRGKPSSVLARMVT